MKNIIMISFAFIAAVIGAGFASGAEVISFFLVYGKSSVIGIIISAALFFCFSYLMLKTCVKHKISSFEEYLSFLMPPFWKKITDIIVFVFMAVSLAAMSAAAGEILNGAFGFKKFFGVVLFSVFCILILKMSVSKITKISGILGILIALGIAISCFYIINFRFTETFKQSVRITASAVSYTAYNGIAAAVILCSMSRFLKTKKQVILTSVFIALGLFFIIISLWGVIGIYYGKVNMGEIPMLFIASRQGKIFYGCYSLILFLAVLTTAVSNGFGVIEYVKLKSGKRTAELLVLAFMIFLSGIGFFNIVNVIYRLCGYASLILPVFMIKNEVKKRKKEIIKEK